MVKQTIVYLYQGILRSKEKEQINETQLEWTSRVLHKVIKTNLTRSFMKGKMSIEMENRFVVDYSIT